MTGPATLMRKLCGKARRISRELDAEQRFVAALREHQYLLTESNRVLLAPLFQLTPPVKHKGWFDWTVLYENRGIEGERKETIQTCLRMDAGWDRNDPNLVLFLEAVLSGLAL